MIDAKMHRLTLDCEPPRKFTYPFHYEPHPLCRNAAQQVAAYLDTRREWQAELDAGKMLGVMVVCDADGQMGFLAAFSGNLAGSNVHDYFVPPVYDLLHPDGEFRRGEREISKLNHEIALIEQSQQLASLSEACARVEREWRQRIDDYVAFMRQAKAARDAKRSDSDCSSAALDGLAAESQFQKAELKRMKAACRQAVATAQEPIARLKARIDGLKQRRRLMSEALQKRIFNLFVVHNALGQSMTLAQVFDRATGHEPPAGAGECAGPKLLEYAYRHGLTPLCMAEFWWGRSPLAEIRCHGHYYPACHSKCGPILGFMLQGLDVDDNPLVAPVARQGLRIAYADDWLVVVDKPAGMLSVPGKDGAASVQELLRAMLPGATGPLVAHRLDMATSGLLVAAKSSGVHKALQEQFALRKVRKTYVAVVEGCVDGNEGYVRLPLRPDLDDRPRQLVDFEHGRQAVTSWRVLSRNSDGTVRLEMHPLTGRTHQLRVHAAHHLGLNAPMVGDRLYGGRQCDRLLLHAAAITFTHPVSGRRITVQSPVPF